MSKRVTGRYVTSKCFCCERKHEAVFHAETRGGHHEENISSEVVRILAAPPRWLFTLTMQSSVLKCMRGCRRINKNSWFACLDLFSCSRSAALFVYAVAPENRKWQQVEAWWHHNCYGFGLELENNWRCFLTLWTSYEGFVKRKYVSWRPLPSPTTHSFPSLDVLV